MKLWRISNQSDQIAGNKQFSSTPGRAPLFQDLPMVWIVTLEGKDYMYLLDMAILPDRLAFALSIRIRQRKTFGRIESMRCQ